MNIQENLLEVKDIHVSIGVRHGSIKVLDGVSISLKKGEILGLVGESGAGKSLFGSAIAGMLEPPIRVDSGMVILNGKRIDNLPDDEVRRIRGRDIGMIFQDPLTSLDPLFTVGDQLIETIRVHNAVDTNEARRRAIRLLEETGLPSAEQRFDHYPHQFSGGMRQRVVIALALCAKPKLVIADEPTTALDVSVQAQIIGLLERMCRNHGSSVILITHDMGVISDATDRVAVMYAGRIVEMGPTREVIDNSRHPYTIGLMASIPPLNKRPNRLPQIEGSMPHPGALPGGCAFHPRCQKAFDKCLAEAPVLAGSDTHQTACWLHEQIR